MSYKTDLQGNNTDLQQILNKVNTLPDHIPLSPISNPASSINIELGYEALDSNGSKIVGTMTPAKFIQGSYVIEEQTNEFSITGLPFAPAGFALVCDDIRSDAGIYPSAELVTGDRQSLKYHSLSYSGGSRRGGDVQVTFGEDSLTVTLLTYYFYNLCTMRYYIWG